MIMSLDTELIEEFKNRLADRYTAVELVELMEISVEDIIEKYIEYILQFHQELVEEVGMVVADNELEEEQEELDAVY